jgi:hypothetical protein
VRGARRGNEGDERAKVGESKGRKEGGTKEARGGKEEERS